MRAYRMAAAAAAFVMLLSGCGSKPVQEQPEWRLAQPKAFEFFDGQYADLWEADFFGGRGEYRLPDGTVLLTVHKTHGPENSYVGGQEGLDRLDKAARQKIIGFYERQGELYDTEHELEKAYAEYLEYTAGNERFDGYLLMQELVPVASNDGLVSILTSVTLPLGDRMGQELRLGAVFDKATGEKLDNMELFSLANEQAVKELLRRAGIEEQPLLSEMEAAFEPERIVLFPEDLQIFFPQGTLPSQQHGCFVSAKYDKLDGVIHDWAVMKDPQL